MPHPFLALREGQIDTLFNCSVISKQDPGLYRECSAPSSLAGAVLIPPAGAYWKQEVSELVTN